MRCVSGVFSLKHSNGELWIWSKQRSDGNGRLTFSLHVIYPPKLPFSKLPTWTWHSSTHAWENNWRVCLHVRCLFGKWPLKNSRLSLSHCSTQLCMTTAYEKLEDSSTQGKVDRGNSCPPGSACSPYKYWCLFWAWVFIHCSHGEVIQLYFESVEPNWIFRVWIRGRFLPHCNEKWKGEAKGEMLSLCLGICPHFRAKIRLEPLLLACQFL